MPVTVRVPTPLRRHTGGLRQVTVVADTVAGALSALVELYPDIRAGLFGPDGALRTDARLFVGPDDIRARQGLDTPVSDGDVIAIVPPVAGA